MSSVWRVEDSVFVIPSVTRQMLDMKVQCLVSNAEGSGGDTTVIDVACEYPVAAAGHVSHVRCSDGPSHVTISGEKAGLAGERLELACLVSAHPPPSVTWHRLDSDSAQVAITR